MKHRNVYICQGGESMQRKNVGKAMYYLVAMLALVSSLALVACGGDDDGDNGQVRSVDATQSLGASNAAMAGQLLQSLPPVSIAGSAFDPDIAGNVTLDFPTPSTFTMTGGNLPAAGVSGNVGFGSCSFTFTQLNGFTGLTQNQLVTFGTCQVRIIANGVEVGGGTTGGTAVLILNNFTSSTVTISVQILDNGILVVISGGVTVTTDINTNTTGTTGSGGTQ